MIKTLVVKCDKCKKEIDGLVENFIEVDKLKNMFWMKLDNLNFQHLCLMCYEGAL